MRKSTLVIIGFAFVLAVAGHARAQTIVSTFGGNAQHTAIYNPTAQHLNAIHWSASIDLNNTGALAHYGAPLLTPANTIIVPQKTGANSGFQINVFNAANGTALYSLTTDYTQPSHNWILPYQPALAVNSVDTRLYYPGNGGTIYYIDNPDSVSHGAPVQQVFYTTLANYQANAAAFNSTVFINTPITSDSSGDVFFGFRVQGTAPAPLNTTQSGFARIDPNGNATFVLAGTAANDANIGRDTHNSGPALSNDGSTVYVAVKGASSDTYGYLLGLDSTTLATKFKVFLKDPRSNNANNADIFDDSTASPMVGPDGDVYFGILGNPFNGSRGFMLHFSSDLTVEHPPGGFGWDNTAAIVPASMAPSYRGTSSYLIFSKYNNYANAGGDSADGVNRIALLDPNATQVDAHSSSNGMLIMREVLTVIGPTADVENRSTSLPLAVREWCINTAAVNPATNSIFTPSEDGRTYRWNLVTNSLSEWVTLGPGVGEPYVPTVIGPDGTVFTLNGGTMWALGSLNGVGVAVTSSTPDVRSDVVGQSLTFTATVNNTGTSGITPTGTVTFTDTTYAVVNGVLQTTNTTLASNVPLTGSGGTATATFNSSTLTADQHFIAVQYSGDSNFSAGTSSLVQSIHAGASATALTSTPNPSTNGQSVTFSATLAAVPPATGTPTGQVAFAQGNTILAQAPVNSSGVVSFSTSTLAVGSDTITATYASDSLFAASSGSTVQTVQNAFNTTTTVSSSANPSVFSQSVTFTASVTSSGGVPTGTVTFKDGTTTLGTSNLNASGNATFSTATLSVASHSITATYNGSSTFNPSTSSVLTQVINKDGTTSTVTSSLNPSRRGQTVTFTATVTANSPGTAIPTGTVTFKNGTTTLGTKTLNSSGKATLATSGLSRGSHSITVVYGGSTSFLGST
ncbi:MAG: Ig-like domain repeat protein, partial [Candidatus Angelobacter sp.]